MDTEIDKYKNIGDYLYLIDSSKKYYIIDIINYKIIYESFNLENCIAENKQVFTDINSFKDINDVIGK